ncbi:MAG: nucleotidyltransferase domain-containing protein [Anaerolineae bacterium]|nr:nucleotidyltransferase domain-containing protein [Anaerolineae bacterium]
MTGRKTLYDVQTAVTSVQQCTEVASIIQQFIRDVRLMLQDNLIASYLFGSYARDTAMPQSDIDILLLVHILTPDIRRQISALASDYALDYDVCISPILKDQQVWAQNQYYDTLFYQEIVRDGILL